jgi:hypothetical protein
LPLKLPGRLLVIAILAWFAVGCGEREFEPDEFVDAANAEGAGLVLGESLTSITEDVEVFAISFEQGSGGGSLLLTDDSDSAREEHERCESAVTLTCYRAANVVLYFDAPPSDAQVARVDAAIRALGDE